MYDHDVYLSPFTWRYGSAAMRAHFSEAARRRLWRRIWVALARAQSEVGLVSPEQLADLEAHVDEIDIERAHAIEAEIQHDLMAEVRCYAEQCPVGGGIIHLGATSMDIEDNAEALRVRGALDLLVGRLRGVLSLLAERIEAHADLATMAWTHLQPAEPTTVGYRLAQYAQDLLADLDRIEAVREGLRGKGIKGACGTSASYAELLAGTEMTPAELEARVMDELGIEPFVVATQTYARKQDHEVLCALAGLAQSLSRLTFDLRVLQSPAFGGELGEPFGEHQVGSSAMPFKRNPVHAENVGSMARLLAALPRVAWDNAAQGVLERTLDDSANRRSTLPEGFLMADEMLRRVERIVTGLRVDEEAAARQLARYGTFAATERLLMVAVRAGGDRQALHEVIREHTLAAWQERDRADTSLIARLRGDTRITSRVAADEIEPLLDASRYLGDAPQRARRLADAVRARIAEASPRREALEEGPGQACASAPPSSQADGGDGAPEHADERSSDR